MARALWASVSPGRRAVPAAAVQAAEDLAKLYEADNGAVLVEVANRMNVSYGNGESPGEVLALLALGSAGGQPRGLRVPSFEVELEGGDLVWDGQASPPQQNPTRSVRGNPDAARILLLEDDPALQRGTTRMLNRLFKGTPVIVVDNVDAAIEALGTHLVTLIISDVDVHGNRSGIDFFHYVEEVYPDLVDRFVFFTGNSAAQAVHYRYLPKGMVSADDLKQAIMAPKPRAGRPTIAGADLQLADIAALVTQAAHGIMNNPDEDGKARGRFGESKVFVSSLWHAVQRDPRMAGVSLDRFKGMLLAAHRQRMLTLARADLVAAMNSDEVSESEIDADGATYHFVVTDPTKVSGRTVDVEAVARAVNWAIGTVGDESTAQHRARGRFGRDEVFVAALWRRLQRDPQLAGMSGAEFKRALVEANRRGLLLLSRADLVGAMDPVEFKESEIADRGATFHFVVDQGPSRRNGTARVIGR